MAYSKDKILGYGGMGDEAASPAPPPATSPVSLETAAAVALTYHGYKRTGSIVWALIYGLTGRLVPKVAVPIAVAQGFGQRKPCP